MIKTSSDLFYCDDITLSTHSRETNEARQRLNLQPADCRNQTRVSRTTDVWPHGPESPRFNSQTGTLDLVESNLQPTEPQAGQGLTLNQGLSISNLKDIFQQVKGRVITVGQSINTYLDQCWSNTQWRKWKQIPFTRSSHGPRPARGPLLENLCSPPFLQRPAILKPGQE